MAKKTNKNQKQENSKNKKSFFKDFKAELKKVIWPTPKQLVNNTVAVITIVLITAIIVFILDLTFETLNKQGVDRIKEVMTTNELTDNTVQNDDTSDEDTSNETSNETETNTENIDITE